MWYRKTNPNRPFGGCETAFMVQQIQISALYIWIGHYIYEWTLDNNHTKTELKFGFHVRTPCSSMHYNWLSFRRPRVINLDWTINLYRVFILQLTGRRRLVDCIR